MLEIIERLRCDLCGADAEGYPFGEPHEWFLSEGNTVKGMITIEMQHQSLRGWTSVYWPHGLRMLHFCPKHKTSPAEPIVDGKPFTEHWPLQWKAAK